MIIGNLYQVKKKGRSLFFAPHKNDNRISLDINSFVMYLGESEHPLERIGSITWFKVLYKNKIGHIINNTLCSERNFVE